MVISNAVFLIDPLEDFHSTQNNVTTLLIDLARDRKKHTFMNILGFINNVLNRYMETPEEQKNGRDKDGALCMIGALASVILGNKSQVANMMEPFFVTHVFPEFKSRFPYLRARVSTYYSVAKADMIDTYNFIRLVILQDISVIWISQMSR